MTDYNSHCVEQPHGIVKPCRLEAVTNMGEPKSSLGDRGSGSVTAVPWWRQPRVYAWASWDFATTPFSALVSTVVFPSFFKEVVLGGAKEGDFLWGLTSSITMLLVVLLAPAAGAYADATAGKRRLLTACTLLNVGACGLFAFLGPGTTLAAMVLYILAGLGYQGGSVFYNAFLPEVAAREQRGTISGLGDALGYLGALVSMGVALPFFSLGAAAAESSQVAAGGSAVTVLFPIVAAFTLLFALPSFLFVRDFSPPLCTGPVSVWSALARQWSTLRNIRRYKNTFRFLLSFLLYTDAVTTMSIFVTLYARSLNVPLAQIIAIFLISQVTAVPGTFLMGRLADRIGAKTTVSILLGLWIVVLGYGVFARHFVDFLIIGLMAGVGVGALTTVSRTLMSLVSPPAHQAEFFGFFAVAGRAAAVLGPLIFGGVSSLTGEPRYALPVLMLLLAVALMVLQGVKTTHAESEDCRVATD